MLELIGVEEELVSYGSDGTTHSASLHSMKVEGYEHVIESCFSSPDVSERCHHMK